MSMSRLIYKVLTSWGVILGVIPFIVLLVYGAYVVSASAQGSAAKTVTSWILSGIAVIIVSLAVFCGLAVLFSWLDEKKQGAGLER